VRARGLQGRAKRMERRVGARGLQGRATRTERRVGARGLQGPKRNANVAFCAVN